MRIISKIRDYYDSGAAFGIDPNVVFERIPTPMRKENPHYEYINKFVYESSYSDIRYKYIHKQTGRHISYKSIGYGYSRISIIVADEKYDGVRIVNKELGSREHLYFWSNESLNEWLVTKVPTDALINPLGGLSNLKNSCLGQTSTSKSLQEFMLNNRIVNICLDIRRGEIYSTFGNNLIINSDALGLFGVQKIVDSTTMFHKVDQWVSQMNDPSRAMIEVSDSVKLLKHGMDNTSFKTPSSK